MFNKGKVKNTNNKMRWKIMLLLLFSLIISGSLTSYLEEYEKEVFMPIRNIINFGSLNIKKYSAEGIPVSVYKSGKGINPVHVAQVVRESALKIIKNSSEKDKISKAEKQGIIRIADFFIKTAEERHYQDVVFHVWTYNFDHPVYGLKAPWLSGMAQGHVIEVMLAAYKITGKQKYLQRARLAANTLAVVIEHGGVAVALGDGLWFEEYASPGVKPPLVLNGNNFALNGLYYLKQLDTSYNELYYRGLLALKNQLPRFDAGVWSKYDLLKIPANIGYQQLHVRQLKELYERTGDKQFLTYANKFQTQLYLPFSAFYRIAVYPNSFLVAIFILNTALIFLLGWLLHQRCFKLKQK